LDEQTSAEQDFAWLARKWREDTGAESSLSRITGNMIIFASSRSAGRLSLRFCENFNESLHPGSWPCVPLRARKRRAESIPEILEAWPRHGWLGVATTTTSRAVRLAPSKEALWPHLRSEGYAVTSPQTWNYNCIALAAGMESEWWWPDPYGDAAWPRGVSREETLEAFAAAFATLGYTICQNGELEQGYEKVAIYAQNGVPTHAARQLHDAAGQASWERGKTLSIIP